MNHPADELLDLLRQGFTVALSADMDQGDLHITAAAANGTDRRFAERTSLLEALQCLNRTEARRVCDQCGAERPASAFAPEDSGKSSTCLACLRDEAKDRRRRKRAKKSDGE